MSSHVSYPSQLRRFADERPEAPAVTCGEQTITRAALEQRATELAVELRALGVAFGDMVTIALPNSIDWFISVVAAWKLGAIPQPASARLPVPELQAIVELADSKVVVGIEPDVLEGRVCLPAGHRSPPLKKPVELPDVTSPSWKAPTSGGSTGRPKLIVAGTDASLAADGGPAIVPVREGCLVMPGPLYHNGPLVWSCDELLWGGHVVLLQRFDAEATLAAIERHRADVVYLVPTMMRRIWRLPENVRTGYDLSSLKLIWHLAEPCPVWLKEAWIEWLGPDRIIELYAGTEAQLATVITGTEWLAHKGSVGRPLSGEIRICDPDGNELPVGEEGEIWMRSASATPTYHYVGAEPRQRAGGWESLGDMGRVDVEGFLYLGDRLQDMILTGGANVYPAEVEAALQEHPAVRSCAVIGLPDDDKGNVVHAIVEADSGSVDEAELRAFLADRLVAYKLPRTIELVDEALRDDAGKVRRSQLRSARISGTKAGPRADR